MLYAAISPPAAVAGFDCAGAAQGAGLVWRWELIAGGQPVALSSVAASLPALIIPANKLPSGTAVLATVQACYAAGTGGDASALCAFSTIAFAVASSPVAPALRGGNARVSEGVPVLLDASASSDPDAAGPLRFAWSCFSACVSADGSPLALAAGAANTVTLRGAPGSGQNYTIRLVVSSADGRVGVLDSWLSVVAPDAADGPLLPVVSVQGIPSGNFAPSLRLVLFGGASAADLARGGPVSTQWSLISADPPQSWVDLADPSVSLTPPGSPSLVVAPGKLAPRSAYVFRLTARDASSGLQAFAEAAVTTGGVPTGGSVTVSPEQGGIGMNTTFTLSAPDWEDEDMPLLYRRAADTSLLSALFEAERRPPVNFPACQA